MGRVWGSLNLSLLLSHYLELPEWRLIEINVRAKLNGRKSDIAYLRRTFFKPIFARDLCLAVVSNTGMYKIIMQIWKFYLFIAARNAVMFKRRNIFVIKTRYGFFIRYVL